MKYSVIITGCCIILILCLVGVIFWKEKREYDPPQAHSGTVYNPRDVDELISDIDRVVKENKQLLESNRSARETAR